MVVSLRIPVAVRDAAEVKAAGRGSSLSRLLADAAYRFAGLEAPGRSVEPVVPVVEVPLPGRRDVTPNLKGMR